MHTPEPEGTDCDDHNACTGYYDRCSGYGYCVFDLLNCNDFYECSLDTCVPEEGSSTST